MEGIEIVPKRENQKKKKIVGKKVDSLVNYLLKDE